MAERIHVMFGAYDAAEFWGGRVGGGKAGGVAQLGERLNGIQEVRGSIPLTSIPVDDPIRLFARATRVMHIG